MKKHLILISFIACFYSMIPLAKADTSINIDGSFDDWSQIPKTEISFPWDDYNYKHMALSADDNYLYLYVDMSPYKGNGYNMLQPAGYQFNIGARHYHIDFKSPDGQYFATHDLNIGQQKEFKVYIYESTNGGVNKLATSSYGIVKRVKSGYNFDEIAEVKIPLADFAIDDLLSQKITVKNLNLGQQSLELVGASSSPYLLAGTGFLTANICLFWIKRRKFNELRGQK